jgi:fido (protein-threonine AMPylation protein)
VPDWDRNSTQLQKNLETVAEAVRDHAHARREPSIDQARQWHKGIMTGLQVPPPARSSWVGHFRGESGPEAIHIYVGGGEGIDPSRVADELSRFEERLRAAVSYLDEKIPPGTLPNTATLEMVLRLMGWVHGEWARIHPFANGNGRTARLWANWVAMRYGVPPFVRLRPRPEGAAYAAAATQAMDGNYEAMIPVFHSMLQQFLNEER